MLRETIADKKIEKSRDSIGLKLRSCEGLTMEADQSLVDSSRLIRSYIQTIKNPAVDIILDLVKIDSDTLKLVHKACEIISKASGDMEKLEAFFKGHESLHRLKLVSMFRLRTNSSGSLQKLL